MMTRLRASDAVLLRHCRSRTKPSSESGPPLAHRAAAPSFSRSRATPSVTSGHQSRPPLTGDGGPPPARVCTGARTLRGNITPLAPHRRRYHCVRRARLVFNRCVGGAGVQVAEAQTSG